MIRNFAVNKNSLNKHNIYKLYWTNNIEWARSKTIDKFWIIRSWMNDNVIIFPLLRILPCLFLGILSNHSFNYGFVLRHVHYSHFHEKKQQLFIKIFTCKISWGGGVLELLTYFSFNLNI